MATIERRGDGFRVRWRSVTGGARSRQCPNHKIAKGLVRKNTFVKVLARGEITLPDGSYGLSAFGQEAALTT